MVVVAGLVVLDSLLKHLLLQVVRPKLDVEVSHVHHFQPTQVFFRRVEAFGWREFVGGKRGWCGRVEKWVVDGNLIST